MPESQLLIGLETSFKNLQKAQNVHIYSILKAYIWFYPLPLVYGLYTCENVENYGWPLNRLCKQLTRGDTCCAEVTNRAYVLAGVIKCDNRLRSGMEYFGLKIEYHAVGDTWWQPLLSYGNLFGRFQLNIGSFIS